MAKRNSSTSLIFLSHHNCHSCQERQLLSEIKSRLPGSIYYVAVQKVKRLKSQYDQVTKEISLLQKKSVGLFGAISKAFKLASLRNELRQIKSTITSWLKSVHGHFFGSYACSTAVF